MRPPTAPTCRSARTDPLRRASRLAASLAAAGLWACLPEGADFDPIDVVAPSFGDEEEREIGYAFDLALQERVALVDDPLVAGFVNDLGRSILDTSGREPFVYRFRLIREGSLNAFAVFGGYVYFHTGTLAAAGSLDELAGVMGHEIAHVRLRHHARMQARSQIPDLVSTLTGIAVVAATGEPGALIAAQGVNVALKLRFSREFEAEADQEGVRLMAAAGYDPRGISRFFERLIAQRQRDPERVPPYLFSHPDVERRIDAVAIYARDLPAGATRAGELTVRLRAAQARLAAGTADDPARPTPPLAASGSAGPQPGDHFDAGEAALAAGRFALAAREYERTLELDPTRALVFVRLGEAYEGLGDRQRAVYAYEQAVRRAGAGGALGVRAEQAAERLTFTVIEAVELLADPAARELQWRARLGRRFRDHTARLRVRWLAADGGWRDTPVAAAGREHAVASLALAPDEAVPESVTVEVLLDDRPVLRRALAVSPAPH
jgi:predicted Zn-dependent protease